ncbi:MAG TPA: putative sulfate exporter family transporter [Usitatibacter sp.]|nr:putative sulfate exporter family transporter [Usitatibacter sp.]
MIPGKLRAAGPGLAVAFVVGIAATFLSIRYGASAMLFALLLGMALNFLAEEGRCLPGIQLASTTVLRTGVALLGLRITIAQVAALGWTTIVLVMATVSLTILGGILVARALGLGSAFGTLTGGAVAICGASAALAIASVLPKHPNAERDASFTVIGVTALSTLAMIVYPVLVATTGLDHRQAGVFLGATIHDVAQVVGAGYSVSQETGDAATIVKLLRVAMLLPACVAIGLALHVRGRTTAHAAPILPWFGVAFAVLVGISSTGVIPKGVVDVGSQVSQWCLVTAISAIGMKTSLRSLVDMGLKPVMLMAGETVFLAAMVAGVLAWR